MKLERVLLLVAVLLLSLSLTGCPKKAEETQEAAKTSDTAEAWDKAFPSGTPADYSSPAGSVTPPPTPQATQAVVTTPVAAPVATKATKIGSGSKVVGDPTLSIAELEKWIKKAEAGEFSKGTTAAKASETDAGAAQQAAAAAAAAAAQNSGGQSEAEIPLAEKIRRQNAKLRAGEEDYRQKYERIRDLMSRDPHSPEGARMLQEYQQGLGAFQGTRREAVVAREADAARSAAARAAGGTGGTEGDQGTSIRPGGGLQNLGRTGVRQGSDGDGSTGDGGPQGTGLQPATSGFQPLTTWKKQEMPTSTVDFKSTQSWQAPSTFAPAVEGAKPTVDFQPAYQPRKFPKLQRVGPIGHGTETPTPTPTAEPQTTPAAGKTRTGSTGAEDEPAEGEPAPAAPAAPATPTATAAPTLVPASPEKAASQPQPAADEPANGDDGE